MPEENIETTEAQEQDFGFDLGLGYLPSQEDFNNALGSFDFDLGI